MKILSVSGRLGTLQLISSFSVVPQLSFSNHFIIEDGAWCGLCTYTPVVTGFHTLRHLNRSLAQARLWDFQYVPCCLTWFQNKKTRRASNSNTDMLHHASQNEINTQFQSTTLRCERGLGVQRGTCLPCQPAGHFRAPFRQVSPRGLRTVVLRSLFAI